MASWQGSVSGAISRIVLNSSQCQFSHGISSAVSPLSMLRKHCGPQGFSHSRHKSPVVFVAVGGGCLGHGPPMRSPRQISPMEYRRMSVLLCTGQRKSIQLRLGQKSACKLFNRPRKSSGSGTGRRGRGNEPVRAAPFQPNRSLISALPRSTFVWDRCRITVGRPCV
jgi:hypothetical protein